MIVRFDALNRFEMPIFTLCNPGSTYFHGHVSNIIGNIVDHSDEEIIFNFNEVSELNMRVYKTKKDDPEMNAYALNMYNAIQNRRMIYTEDFGYFIITDITTGFDGQDFKDIKAVSLEQDIARKNIPFIKDGTYRFLDNLDPMKPERGLLNIILDVLPGWGFSYVDPEVEKRYRTFEDVDTKLNCLGFMVEAMQEAFECVFIFDNKKHSMYIYDQNNYAKNTNIHLTRDDLIHTMNYTENSDELYTALSILGGENITISPINPLGTNTIYDFSYYIDWMSPNLGKKVGIWQSELINERSIYKEKSLALYTRLEKASNLQLEVERIQIQIDMYTKCKNNIVAEEDVYQDPKKLKSMVKGVNEVITKNNGAPITKTQSVKETLDDLVDLIIKASNKKKQTQGELNTINTEVEEYKVAIKLIQDKYNLQNYFTEEEFIELSNYIYEGEYNDDYVKITDQMDQAEQFEQMEILFNRGNQQLERCSVPTQEFDVDIESFIFHKKFEEWSSQLETGSIINVELQEGDVAPLFLSSFTVNFAEKSLSMQFGNRFNKFDHKALFEKVLGNINKTANTLNYVKKTVSPIKQGELTKFREAIETSRNLTMDGALHSENEEIIVDNFGLTARKKLPDGTFDPRQLKIIGKSIVFTEDDWETCSTAVGEIINPDGTTTYGVSGETLIGNIIVGNKLKILNDKGEDMFTIVDGKISSIVKGVNERVDNVENSLQANNDTLQLMPKSIVAEYAQNDSTVIAPEEGLWDVVSPEWVDGLFIWTRTKTTLNDGTVTTTQPVCITGASGKDGYTPRKGVDYFDGTNGEDGTSSYLHVRYSANKDGSGFVKLPTSETLYIGMAVTESTVAPVDKTGYKWSKYIGTDGINGEDGVSSYIHIAYATSSDGSQGFDTLVSEGKTYIGTYTDEVKEDSQYYEDYNWSLIKGKDGKDGYTPRKGVDYFDGVNGENGVSNYIHVRYSFYKDGTEFTAAPAEDTFYIGIAITDSTTAPTDKTAYQWSKYIGTNGIDGINGDSSYIHIAYALSANGEIGFDTEIGAGKTFIGTYTDDIKEDSQDPKSYQWSSIKGMDGKSIVNVVPMYCISTDKTNPPSKDAEWVKKCPEWKPSHYIWTKNIIMYIDGLGVESTEATEPVCSSEWEAVNNVEIGGRNLISLSDIPYDSVEPLINNYEMTRDWQTNKEYVLTIWGDILLNGIPDEHSSFIAKCGNNTVDIGTLKKISDRKWSLNFSIAEMPAISNDIAISAQPMTASSGYEALIDKIKLERGNKGTDWTSAPEDISNDIDNIKGELSVVRTTQSELSQTNEEIKSTVRTIEDNSITQQVLNETVISQTNEQIGIAISGLEKDGISLTNEYSFGVDGLKIAKTSSDLSTIINDDGMIISQKEEGEDGAETISDVLVTNHDGVDARNLKASTYLIIGGRSRLENYETNRTGCFWIG